jgi:hypothetical protein
MVFSFCFIPISSMLFSGKTDAILLSLHASLDSMPVHLLLFPACHFPADRLQCYVAD